jgi:hypothetical protein
VAGETYSLSAATRNFGRMEQVNATVVLRRRWFFWPALLTLSLLGRLGLIRDKADPPRWNGKITGQERAAKWLAERAMRIEVR